MKPRSVGHRRQRPLGFPPPEDSPPRRKPQRSFPRAWRWTVVGLLLFATALRFWDLGGPSLWYDEAYSWWVGVKVSTAASVASSIHEIVPPFSYFLWRVWAKLTGTTEFALRSSSALAGVIAVAALGAVAHRLAKNRAVGLAALALASVAPPLLWASREMRMYGPLLAVVALADLALIEVLFGGERHRRLWAWAWGGLALAALYTVVLSGFWLVGQGTLALVVVATRDRALRRGLARALLAPAVAAALLYLPWLVPASQALGANQGYWPGHLSVATFLGRTLQGTTTSGYVTPEATAWVLGGALVAVAVLMPWLVKQRRWAALYAPLTTLPALGVAYAIYCNIPKWNLQHTVIFAPALVVGLALCVPQARDLWGFPGLEDTRYRRETPKVFPGRDDSSLPGPNARQAAASPLTTAVETRRRRVFWRAGTIERRRDLRRGRTCTEGNAAFGDGAAPRLYGKLRRLAREIPTSLGVLTVALIGALFVYASGQMLLNPDHANDDWRGAVAYVQANRTQGEVVILETGSAAPAWTYYAGDDDTLIPLPDDPLLDVRHVLDYANTAPALNEALARAPGVWVVGWLDDVTDPTGIVATLVGDLGTTTPVPPFQGLTLRHTVLTRAPAFPDEPPSTARPDVELLPDLTLWGVTLPGTPQPADAPVPVRAWWTASDPAAHTGATYQASVRIYDKQGNTWGRADGPAGAGDYRPERWTPDTPVLGQYNVTLMPGVPCGVYTATLILYEVDGPPSPEVTLGSFSLARPSSPPDMPDTITPVVAAGAQTPLDLLGARLQAATARPCETLDGWLFWEIRSPLATSYDVRVSLGEDEVMVLPTAGILPMQWQVGDRFLTQFRLPIDCRALPTFGPLEIALVAPDENAGTGVDVAVWIGPQAEIAVERAFEPPEGMTPAEAGRRRRSSPRSWAIAWSPRPSAQASPSASSSIGRRAPPRTCPTPSSCTSRPRAGPAPSSPRTTPGPRRAPNPPTPGCPARSSPTPTPWRASPRAPTTCVSASTARTPPASPSPSTASARRTTCWC